MARLCRVIKECGLLRFAYRPDMEPVIVSPVQDTCAMAGRNGVKVHAVEDDAAASDAEHGAQHEPTTSTTSEAVESNAEG